MSVEVAVVLCLGVNVIIAFGLALKLREYIDDVSQRVGHLEERREVQNARYWEERERFNALCRHLGVEVDEEPRQTVVRKLT